MARILPHHRQIELLGNLGLHHQEGLADPIDRVDHPLMEGDPLRDALDLIALGELFAVFVAALLVRAHAGAQKARGRWMFNRALFGDDNALPKVFSLAVTCVCTLITFFDLTAAAAAVSIDLVAIITFEGSDELIDGEG